MNNKLECDIVRDLLPSYADGLTSEKTNSAVAEHLSECESCAAVYESIKSPEPQTEEAPAEVDYLKKVRRNGNIRSVLIGTVLMLIGVLILSYRYFYIGTKANAEDVYCTAEVSGNVLRLSGTLTGSGTAVSRVVFEESAGIVFAKVYAVPKTFFNRGDFSAEYTAHETVGQVRIDERIVWHDGTQISPLTSKLLAAVNPYIGDMPSNSRVAEILGIVKQFGEYQNILQTSEKPLGWTLALENPIRGGDENSAKSIMTADSYLMLASIGNLDYVKWQYESGSGTQEFTVTAEEATAYAGKDIKELADSPADFEKLVQKLGIKFSAVSEAILDQTVFTVSVKNLTADEIASVYIDYYFDGEIVGGKGGANADNSTLVYGDELCFDFLSSDFSYSAYDNELSGFSFSLSITDSNGVEHVLFEKEPLSVAPGNNYSYEVSGSAENGFTCKEI